MSALRLTLWLIGSLIGPLNVAIYFFAAILFKSGAVFERLGTFKYLRLQSNLWFGLIGLPSLLSTAITLGLTWSRLMEARDLREHLTWGIRFGGIATIISTFFFLVSGAYYNIQHGTLHSQGLVGSVFGLGFGSLFFGALLIVFFAPVLLASGAAYGWLARKLKLVLVER